MDECKPLVIGQIGQMYGALQDEMQSLESEYSRLKTHLHEVGRCRLTL